MRHIRSIVALCTLFVSTSVAACAAPSGEEAAGDDAAASEDAVVADAKRACSAAAYDTAFAHYKSAVDRAKLRARGETCDEGTLYDITNEAGKATAACADFEKVIATSQWAAPVRNALRGNAALPILTGKIRVKDAAGKVLFSGLKEQLAGVTVFGPAPGVYGNMSKLTFAANGAGTLARLEISDDGNARWREASIKWSLGNVRGSTIELTIVEGTTRTVYDLSVTTGSPGIDLRPRGAGDPFSSLPSECEA